MPAGIHASVAAYTLGPGLGSTSLQYGAGRLQLRGLHFRNLVTFDLTGCWKLLIGVARLFTASWWLRWIGQLPNVYGVISLTGVVDSALLMCGT